MLAWLLNFLYLGCIAALIIEFEALKSNLDDQDIENNKPLSYVDWIYVLFAIGLAFSPKTEDIMLALLLNGLSTITYVLVHMLKIVDDKNKVLRTFDSVLCLAGLYTWSMLKIMYLAISL